MRMTSKTCLFLTFLLVGVVGCDSGGNGEEPSAPSYAGTFVANYGGSTDGLPSGLTRGTAVLTEERLLIMERTSGDSTLVSLTFDLSFVGENRLGVYNFADDAAPITATVGLERGQGLEQWETSLGALTVEAVRETRLEGRFNFPVTIEVDGPDPEGRLQLIVDFIAAREG